MHSVTLKRVLSAPIDAVFKAWTETEAVKAWHSPENMIVPEVELEPKVGGSYMIHMKSPEGQDYIVRGVYKEFDPPRKLVFSWQWDGLNDASEVTVEFIRLSDGQTEITLTHEFAAEAAAGEHEKGWISTFNNLEKFLSK